MADPKTLLGKERGEWKKYFNKSINEYFEKIFLGQ